MKCLRKYKWVKLPRDYPRMGKGIMAHWVRLASRAAFRKGTAVYCGYKNPVMPGMWSGGVVGLKSILGLRSRQAALDILDELKLLGYLTYTLDRTTKQLHYQITDWVVKCAGAECSNGAVYATTGYGFLCLPRNITQRIADSNRIFAEADAWLDLWCHTTYKDRGNAFSFLAPAVQYGKYGAAVSLEILGKRWGWERTKVWRFFRKYADTYEVRRLPGAFGCLVFNKQYPTGAEYAPPEQTEIDYLLERIRSKFRYRKVEGTDCQRINKMIAWQSSDIIQEEAKNARLRTIQCPVAVSAYITRAYFSHGWNCSCYRNCIYDCLGLYIGAPKVFKSSMRIRGPCDKGIKLNNIRNGDLNYGKPEEEYVCLRCSGNADCCPNQRIFGDADPPRVAEG